MRRGPVLATLLCLAGLAAGSAAAAPPAGFSPMPPQDYEFNFSGKTGTIRFEPAVRFTPQGAGVRIDIYIEADLSQMQKAVVAAISSYGRYEECGERISIGQVSLTAEGEAASLKTTVRYQRYQCLLPVPGIPGLTSRGAAKTLLVSQTTRLCMRLKPEFNREGTEIRLRQEITCNQTSSGASLLGAIGGLVGLDDIFRDRVRASAEAALRRVPLVVPEEVRKTAPKLDRLRFYDRGKGVLGIIAEGTTEAGFGTISLPSFPGLR